MGEELVWDYVRVAMNLASVAVTVGLAYYAFSLLNLMEKGVLGKAWGHVARGAIFLSAGTMVFSLRAVALPGEQVLLYLGSMLQIIGGMFILLGVRFHSRVFRPGSA